MTYEEKKRELKSYRWLLKEERHLREEIAELEQEAYPGSPALSDMPKGSGGQRDMSDWAARLDRLERELGRILGRQLRRRLAIEKRIADVEKPEERLILRLRYIDCLSFEEIRKRLNYGERSVFDLHHRAVSHYRSVYQ